MIINRMVIFEQKFYRQKSRQISVKKLKNLDGPIVNSEFISTQPKQQQQKANIKCAVGSSNLKSSHYESTNSDNENWISVVQRFSFTEGQC
jgi:hypothetical protein